MHACMPQHLKLWDPSASTSHVAKLGSTLHPAEIRAMSSFPGTSKVRKEGAGKRRSHEPAYHIVTRIYLIME